MLNRLPRIGATAATLLLSLGVVSCTDDPAMRTVSIAFDAAYGAAPFVCGAAQAGLGASSDQSLTVNEFRLYVHDVRLVTADGAEVTVELTDDGMFQSEGVAYLDFADGSLAGCESDDLTRRQIDGLVPEGDYVGLRFRVGVPFDRNHQNASVAEAPLNLSTMFWAWESGYKFIRLDGASDALSMWRFHLGSTACVGDPELGEVVSCANANRPEVALADFDADADAVVVDVAALVADVDLSAHTDATPQGCMAGPGDPDCAPYFDALGLPFGGSSPSSQTVFRVAP